MPSWVKPARWAPASTAAAAAYLALACERMCSSGWSDKAAAAARGPPQLEQQVAELQELLYQKQQQLERLSGEKQGQLMMPQLHRSEKMERKLRFSL